MGLGASKVLPSVQVALVGLSETGKSHFLSVVCGDEETSRPTHGVNRSSLMYRRRRIEFVEFGWLVVKRGLSSEHVQMQPDVVVWFIDEHDSREEVQVARSQVLGFVMARNATKPMALCVILNRGRPTPRRRAIVGRDWVDALEMNEQGPILRWASLSDTVDEQGLHPHFPRGIYMTELSYRDPQAATLCMDWMLDPTPRHGPH
jgi:hypothetical protein